MLGRSPGHRFRTMSARLSVSYEVLVSGSEPLEMPTHTLHGYIAAHRLDIWHVTLSQGKERAAVLRPNRHYILK